MFAVKKFLKTKKRFDNSIPSIEEFKTMCCDGTNCILVINEDEQYEYLKCELTSVDDDTDLPMHVKYTCRVNGVHERNFMGKGVLYEKFEKVPELKTAISEMMGPSGTVCDIGITIHDEHIVIVSYHPDDLFYFHRKEI